MSKKFLVPLDLSNNTINNLATPVASSDAATKGYVDAAVHGIDWKQSVRVATTENILLSGLQTIDGVALQAGDRVLAKDQNNTWARGIYVAAAGAWLRAADADADGKITAGMSVMVEEGILHSDTQWRLTTNDPIILNNTSLEFAQIGAAVSYSGGTGVQVTGNTIAIDTAVVPRKFSMNIAGAIFTTLVGSDDIFAQITHNLGTADVAVQVYQIDTGETVECHVARFNANVVTLGFAVRPADDTLRVVVIG